MSLATAPKSMNLVSPREAGELLGLPSRMIYYYLRLCPDLPLERLGRRQLGIRLEDLPRIRQVVQECRRRREAEAEARTEGGRWLLAGAAAERLQISRRSLYRKTRAGEIKGERLERPGARPQWRWDPADLSPPAKKRPGPRKST
ncbi:MAG: hypothetical protein ACREN4_09450 [Candidatus Dormibacteria bacterium]